MGNHIGHFAPTPNSQIVGAGWATLDRLATLLQWHHGETDGALRPLAGKSAMEQGGFVEITRPTADGR